VWSVVKEPISEEELREFQTKFDRCRRLQVKHVGIWKEKQLFRIRKMNEVLKGLAKDSQAYRETADSRDYMVSSVFRVVDRGSKSGDRSIEGEVYPDASFL
jgi:hypothetical protein